jgi:hypothetical protein
LASTWDIAKRYRAALALDIQTGRKGGPRVPHPAFDADVEQAAEAP